VEISKCQKGVFKMRYELGMDLVWTRYGGMGVRGEFKKIGKWGILCHFIRGGGSFGDF